VNGNGVYETALRNGSTDTVLQKRLRKRIRMNGNVTLETRHKLSVGIWISDPCLIEPQRCIGGCTTFHQKTHSFRPPAPAISRHRLGTFGHPRGFSHCQPDCMEQSTRPRINGPFEGNACERHSHYCRKVFKNTLWTALRTIFRPKMHTDCTFFHKQSQNWHAQ